MNIIITTKNIKIDKFQLFDLINMVLDPHDWESSFWTTGEILTPEYEEGIRVRSTPQWDDEYEKWDYISMHHMARLLEYLEKYTKSFEQQTDTNSLNEIMETDNEEN